MPDVPSALTEEVVCPEEILITRDEDGAVHFLAYAGRHAGGGFIVLKHLILRGKHVEIFDQQSPLELVPSEIEFEDDFDDEVDLNDLTTCHCGERVMPSGWCTSGHAPSNELSGP